MPCLLDKTGSTEIVDVDGLDLFLPKSYEFLDGSKLISFAYSCTLIHVCSLFNRMKLNESIIYIAWSRLEQIQIIREALFSPNKMQYYYRLVEEGGF